MNRKFIALSAAAALATTFAIAPASAQNVPPPGNVNPGSLNSGAEQTGASNQPRSTGGGAMYGAAYGSGYAPGAMDAYASAYAPQAYAPVQGPSLGITVGRGYGPGYDAYAYDRRGGYDRYERRGYNRYSSGPGFGFSFGVGSPRYW